MKSIWSNQLFYHINNILLSIGDIIKPEQSISQQSELPSWSKLTLRMFDLQLLNPSFKPRIRSALQSHSLYLMITAVLTMLVKSDSYFLLKAAYFRPKLGIYIRFMTFEVMTAIWHHKQESPRRGNIQIWFLDDPNRYISLVF